MCKLEYSVVQERLSSTSRALGLLLSVMIYGSAGDPGRSHCRWERPWLVEDRQTPCRELGYRVDLILG